MQVLDFYFILLVTNASPFFVFFWSSPNFGQKERLNLSKDLFFLFGLHLIFEKKRLNLGENLFFWSTPNFGQKNRLNLSEDLFFLSSPNFGQKNFIFEVEESHKVNFGPRKFWSSKSGP